MKTHIYVPALLCVIFFREYELELPTNEFEELYFCCWLLCDTSLTNKRINQRYTSCPIFEFPFGVLFLTAVMWPTFLPKNFCIFFKFTFFPHNDQYSKTTRNPPNLWSSENENKVQERDRLLISKTVEILKKYRIVDF